jgi:hypothetical protein
LTTSPTPRVRVPRYIARIVTRLVAPLVVDYSASCRVVVDNSASRRLVVDYFAYAARPGASARRAARHSARCAARRRLLRLAQARRRLGLGTENREPRTEPKEPGTRTERTGTEKIGSCSVPNSPEPK